MKITIKVRFNSSYPKFEKVLSSKYILYIPESRTQESENFVIELISKKLGVMKQNVSLIDISKDGEWSFHIEE
jgi:hypothetical protein